MKSILFTTCFFFISFISNKAFSQDSTYSKIRQFYLDGNYSGVIADGLALMFSEPENQESYAVFGAALMKLGELDEATNYLNTGKKYECTDPYFCIATIEKELTKLKIIRNAQVQGEKLIKEGKTDEACETMVKAYKSYPEDGLECVISLLEALIDKKLYMKCLDLTAELRKDKRDDVQKMAKTIEDKLNTYPEVIREIKYNKDYANAEYYYKAANYTKALPEYQKCYDVFPEKNDVRNKISNCKDHIAFANAEQINTLTSLENYVDQYPYGLHAEKVNNKLKYNYLRLGRESKKSGQYDDAVGYFKRYLNRYSTGDESDKTRKELCDIYFSGGNFFKGRKDFDKSANYYQQAVNCSHPNVKQSLVNRMKFRDRQSNKDDLSSFGWQTNPKLGYGLFNSFQFSRTVGFNYSLHFQKLMLSSTVSWETDNNSTVNVRSYPEDWRYSGTSEDKMFFIHAGLTKRILYPLAIYTNFGVSHRQEMKKFFHTPNTTVYDEWAKNAERKFTVPSVDIGLELAARPICFRYGVTIPFSSLGMEKKVFPNFAVGLVID